MPLRVAIAGAGLDAFVSEPQRDRRDVDALGLKEHRVGVPLMENSP
jgi:hypothetical protein